MVFSNSYECAELLARQLEQRRQRKPGAEVAVVAREHRRPRIARLNLIQQSEQSVEKAFIHRVGSSLAKDDDRYLLVPLNFRGTTIARADLHRA